VDEEDPMPKSIKVAVVTQAEGAHLSDYFGALLAATGGGRGTAPGVVQPPGG
jgi:hypothetical protein